MDVNEIERLSTITLTSKLRVKEQSFLVVLHFTIAVVYSTMIMRDYPTLHLRYKVKQRETTI